MFCHFCQKTVVQIQKRLHFIFYGKSYTEMGSNIDMLSESEPRCDINCAGFRYFFHLLNGSKLEATDEDLIKYAKEDLHLKWDNMPANFVECLPSILVAFMRVWSGWRRRDDYWSNSFTTQHYFTQFQKYMRQKLRFVIEKDFRSAVENVRGEKEKLKKKNVHNLEFAPFSIALVCPPAVINTVLFSNNSDDVIMKQHMGPKWPSLDIKKILNWPYIEVDFKMEDLHFRRLQATDYSRFLDLEAQHLSLNLAVVECAEIINKRQKQEVFTLRYMETYVKDYLDSLKNLTSVSASKMTEIKEILRNFLDDINHMKVNLSIATNTEIVFKLSTYPYIRNKKLIRHHQPGASYKNVVGYCEVVHPKVKLAVFRFKGEQLEADPMCFTFPKKIRENKLIQDEVNFAPEISYSCTFCKVSFVGKGSHAQMASHVQKSHSMEQPVKCVMCQQQLDVLKLTEDRWQHKGCFRPKPLPTPTT